MMNSHRLHLLAALMALLSPTSTSGFSASRMSQSHQFTSSSRSSTRYQQQQRPLMRLDNSFLSEQSTADEENVSQQHRVEGDDNCPEESPLSQANRNLPPVIQHIADERLEFNMNLGKAMDTLRKDLPDILLTSPDYSIFHSDIEVIDPSGVRLQGLDNYKSSMTFFRTFIKFWFSTTSSRLQYRMVYDFCRSSIRVSWNIVLIPKFTGILGSRPLFLDGVSHYKLGRSSGKIIEHKIENLVMNDSSVAPPYGIFQMLQHDLLGQRHPKGVPVGAGALSSAMHQ